MGELKRLKLPVEKRSRGWKTILRVTLTMGLLAVVYGTTDLKVLATTLGSVSLTTAFSIAALYAISQVISCSKWWIILRGCGLGRGLAETLRAYFLGMFVNTFGLGTLGGDVVRAMAIKPPRGKRTTALASVVVDRLQGLAVLASIGAIAIFIEKPAILGPIAPLLALPAVGAIALALIFGPRVTTAFFSADSRLGKLAHNVRLAFPERLSEQAAVTTIAIAFHCTQIFTYYIISQELGSGMSLLYLFATVPLINIASTLPISVNGLGVRESLTIILFGAAGVPMETAVAFSAIWILAVTAVSALGGIALAYLPGETVESAEATAAREEDESGVAQIQRVAR